MTNWDKLEHALEPEEMKAFANNAFHELGMMHTAVFFGTQSSEPVSTLLVKGFRWSLTPEGHEYWSNLRQQHLLLEQAQTLLIKQ